MSDYLKKIKTLYANWKIKKISYKRQGVKPDTDWSNILAASFFVSLCLVVFAVYFYIQIDQGNYYAIENKNSENGIKINNELLKKTVDDLDSRQNSFSNINNFNTQDPAL